MQQFLIALCVLILSLASAFAQTDGKLTVTATTSKTTSPKYGTKNIVALWVEDNNGKFVKTILAYAGERKKYLKNWKASTAIAGSPYNVVDASTGATKKTHGVRTYNWKGKTFRNVVAADGKYRVRVECTDNEKGIQNYAVFTFDKGPNPVILTPEATNRFSNISIIWEPTNTALLEINQSDLYKVYPNPAVNSIYVNGFGVKSVTIINENGQQMLSTSNQSIDVSQLKSGLYFCRIQIEGSQIYKKFIKK